MTLNDFILAIIILLMLLYAIYDEFVQHLLKGKPYSKLTSDVNIVSMQLSLLS